MTLSEAQPTAPLMVDLPQQLSRTGHPTRIGIIGLGYVGLPTAIAFADAGCQVLGCDVDVDRLDSIRAADVDLLELDRHRLLRLLGSATLGLTAAGDDLADADVVVVCVPTPIDSHLVPDLTALRAACATAVAHARTGQTIVLTSTSYIGCTRELLVRPLRKRGFTVGTDVFVAFSPERIDPGNEAHRHDTVPRIAGGVTPACRDRAVTALQRITTFVHAVGSPEAAEAAKLLENTFRAVNIAFVNEFADACRDLELDVLEVIEAAATKPYGFMAFYPGPGVGGHCVPCDPHYLLWQLRAQRTRLPLTESAMSAIATRPRMVAARAREVLLAAGHPVHRARVLVIGVTYKPGVQDVRESPALEIMAELARHGADLSYTDPHVGALQICGQELTSVEDPAAADPWDLVVLHTRHSDVDHGWLDDGTTPVLDATYRAVDLPHRAVI